MTNTESRIMQRVATVRRVDALFRSMANDFLLREQFVTDPSQVLAEYIHGERLPPEQASVCNQLVYAVMSNRLLLVWLHEYALAHHAKVPSGRQFINDFSCAVAQRGGAHVVVALIRSAADRQPMVIFHEDLLHFLLTVGAARNLGPIGGTGMDGTNTGTGTGDTGTGTGTDTGTGTGTDTATGTGTGTGTGTDTGTGTGTGTGTNTGTGTGTGTDATGTGTGTGTGTDGTLTAITWSTYITGTSTGTGTGTGTGTAITLTGTGFTRSPFTGTDHATDNRVTEGGFNDFAPSYVMVTLDALAKYAARLMELGALEYESQRG